MLEIMFAYTLALNNFICCLYYLVSFCSFPFVFPLGRTDGFNGGSSHRARETT